MAIYQSVLTSTRTFSPSSEVVTTWQTDGAAHKLKPRLFHKSTHLQVHSVDFHSSVNRAWQYYQTPTSAVASEQFCLLNSLLQFRLQPTRLRTSKVQMAFSHRNSSTLVPPLGTPFNKISHFSEPMAYPPNVPRRSRRLHQRGHSSPRSPSSTIQPAQTVSPVPGPSIIPVDNDPNWEDAPTTNLNTNNNIANRPTSSTYSRSKPCWSDNTNEWLAEVLGQLANTLNANQTPGPNTNSRGTKAHIPNTFSGTEPDKLNNFLFQYKLYFHANLAQFDTDIVKINFTMTYLTGVAQDWFEMGLNQKDQGILQDWLSDWNLFVDELRRYFGLLDSIGEVANMLDNLCMKPSNKISTYNVDFMRYASQLGWGNSVLCYHYYQGLPNWIQDPIST